MYRTFKEILQELYDVKFIDRQLTVKHKGDLDGVHQTKITSAGRQYFYDVLLPNRRNNSNPNKIPTQPEAKTIGQKIYGFIEKYVFYIVFGILGAVASYFTIWQFFIDNNWFNMGKK